MHRRRSLTSLVLVLLAPLAVSLTGCDGDSSSGQPTAAGSTAVDATFHAKVEQVCRPYNTYNDAHPFPWSTFEPEAPDRALLPEVGAFFDRNPANHTIVRDLRRLGEPASDDSAWHTVLVDAQRDLALGRQQIRLARHRQASAFVRNVHRTRAMRVKVFRDLSAAGLSAESACQGVI